MTVTIGTYNVDNIKSNVVYTQSLIDICDILFIQEHWLYKFEQSTIQTLFPTVNWFVKSADEYDPQLLTHYARGHAGIGILWNNKVDHLMEVQREEGSERIAVCTTVAQTRHFIKHLLHDFTKHLLHDFTISSTILQFPPRFYNFLHDFTISSTILQFPPRFYNFLHDFTISSTILQFPPRFYNFLHDFTISSTILQFPPRFYHFLHDFTIFSTILQFPPRFYKTFAPRFYKTFSPRFYNFLHDFVISWRKL